MAVQTTLVNKPFSPRGNDQSPLAYNRAKLFSGKALDFDGLNDVIEFDGYTTFTGDFSFSMYIKTSTIAQRGLFCDSANNDGILLYTIDQEIRIRIDGSNYIWDTGLPIYNNEMNHLVFVRNGVEITPYLNGVAGNSVTASSLSFSFNQFGRQTTTANYFDGQAANLKAFNTALTAAQVADLYNNPEKIVPTGVDNTALKLWLPMQEGAGTTAYDGSSVENGPDLIVNGDFATDSDWTKGAGWSIGGGVASHDSSLGPGDLYQDFNLTIGKSYKITIEITATDTTELYFMTDSGDYVEVTGSPIGVHSHVFVADDSSHRVGVRGSGNWDGSVDNITLEELNFANHGTISGATYVHGIGAPVAQTAVIDWNKGTNLLEVSEDFSTAWTGTAYSVTANATTAPDGQTTADEITFATTLGDIQDQFVNVANETHVASCWFKNGTIGQIFFEVIGGTPDILGQATINLSTGTLSDQVGSFTPTIEAYADGWYRVAVGDLGNASVASPSVKIKQSGGNTGTFYVWGAQVEASDSLGAYIPNHTGTPITSEVLLPQGLTSGRDITGVNLFENVRKQGALNLDGNSWAEVHDNASLDITDAITLECWIYYDGSNGKGLLGRWGGGTDNNYLLYTSTSSIGQFYINTTAASNINTSTLTAGNWYHLVGTYDGSDMRIYLNGSESSNTSKTGSISTSADPIEIGRYSGNSANAYADQIAQPRIYNRALTAEEVQRNYNAGKNTYTN